jgi:hypothetical protein
MEICHFALLPKFGEGRVAEMSFEVGRLDPAAVWERQPSKVPHN